MAFITSNIAAWIAGTGIGISWSTSTQIDIITGIGRISIRAAILVATAVLSVAVIAVSLLGPGQSHSEWDGNCNLTGRHLIYSFYQF